MTITFYAVRHGNKDGDKLTPKGEAQIKASVELISNLEEKLDRIFHSKTNRTKQCATIAAPIVGKSRLEEVDGLSVDKPFAEALKNDMSKYQVELEAIMSAGGHMAAALHLGKYPVAGREHFAKFLVELASQMEKEGKKTAIGFSHSPFCSLAVPEHQAETMPYDIGEADIVVYTIENGAIVDATHIPCPYKE